MRSAYGIAGTVQKDVSGRGQTVAILDAFASPTLYADAAKYAAGNDPGHPLRASQFSEPVFPVKLRSNRRRATPPAGTASRPSTSKPCTDGARCAHPVRRRVRLPGRRPDEGAELGHGQRAADVITNSYGSSGSLPHRPTDRATPDRFQQAAARGHRRVLLLRRQRRRDRPPATGTPTTPASSPWVTAVGGTALGVDADNSYGFETGWGTSLSALHGSSPSTSTGRRTLRAATSTVAAAGRAGSSVSPGTRTAWFRRLSGLLRRGRTRRARHPRAG